MIEREINTKIKIRPDHLNIGFKWGEVDVEDIHAVFRLPDYPNELNVPKRIGLDFEKIVETLGAEDAQVLESLIVKLFEENL